jgi:hypothetical protein
MTWADTTAGVMKMRNGANNAWITLYQLDGEWTSIAFENGTAGAPSIYFKDSGTDTGFYSPGADQVGISTGGIGRITIDGSGNVNIDSNTLYVDAATNRVGIGTNSPQAVCHVSLGNILLSNAYYLSSRNAADNASLSLIGRDTSNNVVIDPDGYGIKVGGTTLVTTSAGRVGIGTTSPTLPFVVSNAGAQGFEVQTISGTLSGGIELISYNRNTSAYAPCFYSSSYHAFAINNSEKARLDSSGRLLVGTSSSSSTSAFVIQGYAGVSSGAGEISITRGGSPSAADQGLGTLRFQNNNGNDGALIDAVSEGAWTSGSSHPSRLTFSTTPSGSASPVERLRINSIGQMLYGTTTKNITSPNNPGFEINTTNTGGMGFYAPNASNNNSCIIFQNTTGRVGFIDINASNVTYATSSDYRLKENVVPVTDAINRLLQLNPSRFNFIADPDHTVDGFIAHEAQAVVPECVTGQKDAVDDDGNPVYQGIDQSKLVPLLTAALQEAVAEIKALKDRVTALESA